MARFALRSVRQGCLHCASVPIDVSFAFLRLHSLAERSCSRRGVAGRAAARRPVSDVRVNGEKPLYPNDAWSALIRDRRADTKRVENYLAKLSDTQRHAATVPARVIRVIAGPGSGKTRVLISRVAMLLSQYTSPDRLLLLTFTNKAANEMRDRLATLFPEDALLDKIWSGTFHATAAKMLRHDMERLKDGRTSNFRIIDEEESNDIIARIIRKTEDHESIILPSDSRAIQKEKREANIQLRKEMREKTKAMAKLIARVKETLVTTHRLTGNEAGRQFVLQADVHASQHHLYRGDSFAQCFDQYHAYLREQNLADFGDLTSCMNYLLRHDNFVRQKYREKFEHILVDEMQDTNLPQYEFLRLLLGSCREMERGRNSLFVVGDPNQCIYSFRGAQTENLGRSLEQDYAKLMTTILLVENYRSVADIVQTLGRVVRRLLPSALYREMITQRREGEERRVCVKRLQNDRQEAAFVSSSIRDLTENKGYSLDQIAVLYRVHKISFRYESELQKQQIPYSVKGWSFWEKAVVKDCVAYLRFIINPGDFSAFERIYNVPSRGFGETTHNNLQVFCEKENHKFPQFLVEDLMDIDTTALSVEEVKIPELELPKSAKVTKKAREGIQTLRQVFVFLRSVARRDRPHGVLESLLTDCGYRDFTEKHSHGSTDDKKTSKKLNALEDLKEAIRSMQQLDGSTRAIGLDALSRLIQDACLMRDVSDEDEKGGGVQLMTIHAAKGLEFKAVFLVGCEEGTFPIPDEMNDQEDEERLMFVAVSRAQDFLFITHAQQRFSSHLGRASFRYPSRFLESICETKGHRINHFTRSQAF